MAKRENESATFLEALKRCLRAKGLTYGDLAKRLQLSEASVKRIFAAGTLSLARIGRILEVLDMSFLDVAKLSSSPDKMAPQVLTFEQESVLAADAALFAFFHLLLFGKTSEGIVKAYALSKKDAENYLRTLAAIGLIERLGDRVRLLTQKAIIWQDDGPLRRAYQRQIVAEFFADAFAGEQNTFHFVMRNLSRGSQSIINRKLELLRHEADELAAVDRVAQRGKTQVVAMALAMRPFAFSVIGALKQRR